MVAQVEILDEREDAAAWTFRAQVIDEAGDLHRHELRLAFADYGLWCVDGGSEPAEVAAAVLHCLYAHLAPGDVRERIDAALSRRLVPTADEEIPRLIG